MTFQNKANLDSQGVENLSEGAYFLFELAFSQDIYKVFKRKSVIFFLNCIQKRMFLQKIFRFIVIGRVCLHFATSWKCVSREYFQK